MKDLDLAGQLPLRVNAYLPVNENSDAGTPFDPYYEKYQQGQIVSPHVRVAGLKVFTDFNNATVLLWKQDDLNAFLLKEHQKGWQLAVKSVSARSMEMVLKAFEFIQQTDIGIATHRHRLEHALFISPDQVQRIQGLGLVPIINLNNPGQLVGMADVDAMIANEPKNSYSPWQSLVQAGIPLASCSGFPSNYADEPTGAPFGSPIHLIYQAVTRVGNLGIQPEPWMMNEAITAEDALRIVTIGGAYANFQDDILGSLTPGKLADMVILSDNPLTVSSQEINNIKVSMTMIDGKVEYCASGSETIYPTTTGQPASTVSTPPSGLNLFSGTWSGPDPDDGSKTTVILTQNGDQLSGTFSDTFSGNIPPPGFSGNGTGNVTSDTSAQMLFALTRHDGKTIDLEFTMTLSSDNNQLTLTYEGGLPISLTRE